MIKMKRMIKLLFYCMSNSLKIIGKMIYFLNFDEVNVFKETLRLGQIVYLNRNNFIEASGETRQNELKSL